MIQNITVAAWAGWSELTAGWLTHARIENFPDTASMLRVSGHGTLLLSPLGLTIPSPFLLRAPMVSPGCYLWATLLPTPKCPPLLTLPVFPWGAGTDLMTSAVKLALQLQSPDTEDMSTQTDSCHLTLKNVSCPCLLTLFFSPRISPLPGMVLWSPPPCPGLKLEAILEAMQSSAKDTRLGGAQGTIRDLALLLGSHRVTSNV